MSTLEMMKHRNTSSLSQGFSLGSLSFQLIKLGSDIPLKTRKGPKTSPKEKVIKAGFEKMSVRRDEQLSARAAQRLNGGILEEHKPTKKCEPQTHVIRISSGGAQASGDLGKLSRRCRRAGQEANHWERKQSLGFPRKTVPSASHAQLRACTFLGNIWRQRQVSLGFISRGHPQCGHLSPSSFFLLSLLFSVPLFNARLAILPHKLLNLSHCVKP